MLTISVQTRNLKKEKANRLRKSKYIPGIVYGYEKESRAVKISEKDFGNIFRQAGGSALADLEIDKEKAGKVIINDYQVDPINNNVIHFDLHQVRMDKKITAKVPLRFIGESPAVKNEGGILVKKNDKFEIKCLPGNLIHDIEIDLSSLKNINDHIRVRDLKMQKDIDILADKEEVIVSVIKPRVVKTEELKKDTGENVGQMKDNKDESEEENKDENKTKKTSPEQKAKT